MSGSKIVQWGPQGPAGTWSVSGKEPGQTYEGTLSLSKSGSVFVGTLQSDILGERKCTGIIFNGLFLLARSAAKTRPGIVWYILAANGDLEAVWNSASIEGMTATGRATSGQPGVIPGIRPITYYDTDGNALQEPVRKGLPPLNLRVRQCSEVYELDWLVRGSEDKAFVGIGLDVPNGLASAWDTEANAGDLELLVYTVDGGSQGRSAHAVSASQTGGGQLGKEQIRRS